MNLNERGKKNLRMLVLLTVLAAAGSVLSVLTQGWGLLLLTILPPSYFASLKSMLHRKLEVKVFEHFGFKRVVSRLKTDLVSVMRGGVADLDDIMSDYQVAKVTDVSITNLYEGSLDGEPIKIINFTSIVRQGDNAESHYYFGLEFLTVKEHLKVQLIDQKNPFKRRFKGVVAMESNDFNKMFLACSPDSRNPFYQLDPDTMNDLMSIRKEFNAQINIEMVGHKVFIYSHSGVYYSLFMGVLGFEDVINQEITSKSLSHYHKGIQKFLEKFRKVFKLMDWQAQKIELTR